MTVRVANAPCSWGALEFDLSRDSTPGSLDKKILTEMAAAGYTGTELGDWGLLPTEPEPLTALLAANGLDLVGAFVPVPWTAPDAVQRGRRDALPIARLLAAVGDHPFVILADDNGADPRRRGRAGRVTPADGLSPDDRGRFAKAVDRVAAEVTDETGLPVVFHHHGGGWIETPDEIARLLDSTTPDRVGLCLDTGHYALGGGNPVDALERFAGRIPHVHFKDFDPRLVAAAERAGWDYFDLVREGVFPELGAGAVSFSSIADSLRRNEYTGWVVVEQDVLPGMGTPLESARRNRAFLEGLGW